MVVGVVVDVVVFAAIADGVMDTLLLVLPLLVYVISLVFWWCC